jgi:AAA+ superfamily predicted ATPase
MEASYIGGLLPALQRLDHLLEQAINIVQASCGSGTFADPFRGLHISQEEIEYLFTLVPGEPRLFTQDRGQVQQEALHTSAPLAWLTRELELSPFEVDVIIIALAPELDLRYERIYAYLQDNVSRKWPSVELVLHLLCPSIEAKLLYRKYFAAHAPLIRYGLLRLIADPNQVQPSLLSHYLKLDEQLLRFLLNSHDPGTILSRFSRVVQPEAGRHAKLSDADIWRALRILVEQAHQKHQPLHLHFYGPGSEKMRVAEALAAVPGTSLLYVDALDVMLAATKYEQAYTLLFREAWLHQAILYIDHLDALYEESDTLRQLLACMTQYRCITIFASEQQRLPDPFASSAIMAESIAVPFPELSFAQRLSCWQNALADAPITLAQQDKEALAARFRLNEEQIHHVARTALSTTRWRAMQQPQEEQQTPDASLLHANLFAVARNQSGYGMQRLARKLEPVATWEDIILPSDQVMMLREICNRATYRHVVYETWGFTRKLRRAKGLHILFSGSPGTGKTLAAEVIAHELGLDLYRIDLSQVVSKYIGETEKNLERIFTAAEHLDAILFFDEADSLFGKRSQVNDAHDRYANIEVSYLLQSMEDYEGITILATNLRQNMDEAFTRRMHYSVDFPFPDETHRYHIWRTHFPAEAPCGDDIDFTFLARQFKLSGGNIRNVVLTASFLAAADGENICMKHLILAVRREFQKLGKACTETVFGSYFTLFKAQVE